MALSWPPEIFRNALDHIPDAVLISDCAGAVRFANRRAPQLLGYAREELLGQDLERLLPERFRRNHAVQRQLSAARWGRPMGSCGPLAARRKDGSEFPAQISFGFIEDAQGTFTVATIRDISAYQGLSRNLSRARDAATHAERAARQARDALAATRRANAAQWTSACYLLRQQLQNLSIFNGLLAGGRQPDEVTLKHALSDQVEATVTMMNLLDPPDDPSKLESPSVADATDTPYETVARLIWGLGRDASRPQPMSAGARVAQVNHTALVVLRDWGMREAAASLLRVSGYGVLTAGNAQEARAIARLHPEVGYVLTEQALGDAETGAAVIDALRSMLGASLKTVLISDDATLARANGFDPGDRTRVARIPVKAEELLRMMEDLPQGAVPGSAGVPDSVERHAR